MEKKLDLSKSVYDLVKEYPEVTDIMKELGFSEITNKVMLNSVGKIMTIPKGAKMKGVSMIDIVGAFMKAGFTLEGDMPKLRVILAWHLLKWLESLMLRMHLLR